MERPGCPRFDGPGLAAEIRWLPLVGPESSPSVGRAHESNDHVGPTWQRGWSSRWGMHSHGSGAWHTCHGLGGAGGTKGRAGGALDRLGQGFLAFQTNIYNKLQFYKFVKKFIYL
jgi:hypothetical protein